MIFKSDKLDYLRGPKTKKKIFDDLFNIGQGPSNVGKLNWNLLGFSSFISILGQCGCGKCFAISIGQIQPKLIYGLVTYGLNGL